jgi:hypothetical protein
MIPYVKALAALVVTTLAVGAFVGCGFNEQDATDRCKQEQAAKGASCFNEGTLKSCIQAYEDCGESARSDDSKCPQVYTCPGSSSGGGAGGQSTTSTTGSTGTGG